MDAAPTLTQDPVVQALAAVSSESGAALADVETDGATENLLLAFDDCISKLELKPQPLSLKDATTEHLGLVANLLSKTLAKSLPNQDHAPSFCEAMKTVFLGALRELKTEYLMPVHAMPLYALGARAVAVMQTGGTCGVDTQGSPVLLQKMYCILASQVPLLCCYGGNIDLLEVVSNF